MEFDDEIIETITPHAISKVPNPIVILGIDWPATENSSLMLVALVGPLKFL